MFSSQVEKFPSEGGCQYSCRGKPLTPTSDSKTQPLGRQLTGWMTSPLEMQLGATQRAPPPRHCPIHSARRRLNTPTRAFEASALQLTCAIHTPRHSPGFSSSCHLCNQSGRAPHSPGSCPGAAQGLQDARPGPLHTALWCTQGS